MAAAATLLFLTPSNSTIPYVDQYENGPFIMFIFGMIAMVIIGVILGLVCNCCNIPFCESKTEKYSVENYRIRD